MKRSNLVFIATAQNVTVLLDGRAHIVKATATNYDAVMKALKAGDEQGVRDSIKITEFIARVTSGLVQIGDDPATGNMTVFYDGKPAAGVVVDRTLDLLNKGQPMMHLVNFMNNVYRNPLTHVPAELFEWLEGGKMPITSDGCFLAYKRVNRDYTSVHDSKTMNKVGTIVQMPREKCDANRARECSTGLHFCSRGYLGSFSGDVILILKVDPADVVAIPRDYNYSKGRAWRYEVIGEYNDTMGGFFDDMGVVDTFGTYGDKPVENVSDDDNNGHKGLDGSKFTDDDKKSPAKKVRVKPGASAAKTAAKSKHIKTLKKGGAVYFERDGKKFYVSKIVNTVNKLGQRGASKELGVPRTSLQDWLAAIAQSQKVKTKTAAKPAKGSAKKK